MFIFPVTLVSFYLQLIVYFSVSFSCQLCHVISELPPAPPPPMKSLGAGYKTGNKTFFVLGVLLILLAILSARNSHGSTNATTLLYHRFILEGTFLLNVIFRSLKELQYQEIIVVDILKRNSRCSQLLKGKHP